MRAISAEPDHLANRRQPVELQPPRVASRVAARDCAPDPAVLSKLAALSRMSSMENVATSLTRRFGDRRAKKSALSADSRQLFACDVFGCGRSVGRVMQTVCVDYAM